MKVRLIGKANGVGLSRDFELLAAALRGSGCEVTLHGCERRDRKLRRNVFTRLAARARLPGPIVVVELSSTAYVAPEFDLRVDDFGNLQLEAAR